MGIKVIENPNKKVKPEDSTLKFGRYFTDHMMVMDYKDGSWQDPEVLPYEPIPLDPASMVFHYGQAAFEGMKAYHRQDGGINLFRAMDNFKRLNSSHERLCIPHLDEQVAYDALCKLIEVDKEWVPKSPNTSLYIRPFTIATEAAVGVHPSNSYKFIIIICPVGPYFPEGLNPVKICIEDEYVRAVRGGLGFTKATANYAASLKGQVKAQKMGYTQVLWLDGIDRKYIEEVGTMNVFFLIDGVLVTPELSGSILPGITRNSVIQLAQSWGVKTEERKITVDELYEAHASGKLQEAFGSGTAAVISPIGQFSWNDKHITVGNGETGEFSRKMYDTLTGIQYGKIEDTFGWVTSL